MNTGINSGGINSGGINSGVSIGVERSDRDQDRDPDLLRELRERFELAYEYEKENREEAETDLQLLKGQTWKEGDRLAREEDGRPCMEFPVLAQYVDQVIGDWRQNRASITVRPARGAMDPPSFKTREGKDIAAHEVFAGLLRSLQDQDASIAHDTGLEQAVSCGFGHWRILTEYIPGRFDQQIRIERITDQFSVYWDPASSRYSREDAQWCIVAVSMPRVNFESRWPDAVSASDLPVPQHLVDWVGQDEVRVAEYWRKIPVTQTLLHMTDGRVLTLTEEVASVLDELARDGVVVNRERTEQSHRIEWRLCTGMEELESRDWPGLYIPIVSVWGKEQNVGHGKLRYRSLVRNAHDAQRMFDYMRTAGIEAMALAPKAPYVIGKSQLGNYEALWAQANVKNLAYLPFDDTVNKTPPQRQSPGYPGSGFFNEAVAAREDIKAAVGMYDASVGARSNETSGRAILARQRESDVMSFAFLDNMGRSMEYEARILLDLIPRIYDTERVLNALNADDSVVALVVNQTILDEDSGKTVTLNDLSIGEFDVSVNIGPSYTTQRQEAAESMIQFATAIPSSAVVIGDLIAKNLDWPGADVFAKRLQMLLPPEIRAQEESSEEVPPHVQFALSQAREAIGAAEQQIQALTQQLQTLTQEAQSKAMEVGVAKTEAGIAKQELGLERRRLAVEYDERVLKLEKELRDVSQDLNRREAEQIDSMNVEHQKTMVDTTALIQTLQTLIPMVSEAGQQTTQASSTLVTALSGVEKAVQAMTAASNQIVTYLTAPRTLILDASGSPIGVEVAGFGDVARLDTPAKH